ncbi:exo-beta-N-acetylmuramidase NamZ family protein [Marinoscillum furvescens]|uniref:Uncharacterized protein YbbC (DUF1343 family) n=1 Tax=Marinoscillum furvescens DSM 4134 TaxID=1122208 RepID=A0A3D9L9B2_MARFU|nr:DUF1343 domain-containing protein [Marinoscillum furvescens]REE02067.1 uncharacterized protein YbbC (DUF1343 family) [Marinoscillum furvescens DSM 4134]
MRHFLNLIFLLLIIGCNSQKPTNQLLTGADQMDRYLPQLKDRQVGLFVNHTSLIGETHLTDSLLALGVNIKRVFSPEHGFKGNKPDGEKIDNEQSDKFELASLYGKNRKPTDEQISDLDVLIVDIQDVGVRFYTYASTMTYLMDACARLDVPVIVLDRPNPNGSYVDGPMLDEQFKSFVGLHPIPLVHGLTLGELAQMINGEGWLESGLACNLEVIPVTNWSHDQPYSLPVRPSPNLPNDLSIALYPSLALFEGTVVSIGRGTDWPFQVIGHPAYDSTSFTFTPTPNAGSKYPPLEGQKCFGVDLTSTAPTYAFTLKYILDFHQTLSAKEIEYFNAYFPKLAGTDQLQKQIAAGMSEDEIRATWQEDLSAYNVMRRNYLLYPLESK